jgi:hypothetical protein
LGRVETLDPTYVDTKLQSRKGRAARVALFGSALATSIVVLSWTKSRYRCRVNANDPATMSDHET